uniref:Replication factor C subunit 1 n=1 Tax=Drosophila melanogaster TaxID=7227 RepID=RFC1_DROME|nr:germ line transcription factor 1, isoform A [Drosophila melanogaster]P35600.2 RecName: Full=Replication factor C subunit 1; AltName: Full=Activator 1 140 kDa subunit; AltName: Full=Activator 1 subunit 1; AltName: Full=Germline transcription factor 1; AltName: Full=Replication factor C large subunit [Drosophila melanogaster]AAB58311.1 replication factor C large subunit [Drosophila melanogaster]AAF52082.1 germ line transcription factor 1, isoform A [Drosophila melanogaster]AAO39621.1 GH06471p |eukprot:NP_524229.1 germ line transcription factor 1, isoform A [Drosophila melanogaster]
MQRGIDSFFKRLPAKAKSAEAENGETPSKAPKRRKAVIISSDEDEVVSPPETKKRKASKTASSEDDVVAATPEPIAKKARNGQKPALSKLKRHVDPTELFGGETKRVIVPKPKTKAVLEFENEDIDRSLMEVDLDESIKEAAPEKKVHSITRSSPSPKRAKNSSPEPPKPKSTKSKATTPRVKKEKPAADLESSVLTDEERHERKRASAVLYQKYKNRSSCLNPGSKEIPKGSPDCLSGLTFVVTGVLESMEREEAESVIKEYGGKVMTVVGKKLKYLVVGEEAGPKKLAVAEELNIPILSEDGLFDLIREKSGIAKQVKEEKKSPKKEHSSEEKGKKEVKTSRRSSDKKEKEATKLKYGEKHDIAKHKVKEEHTSPKETKDKLNDVPAVTLKVKKEPSSQKEHPPSPRTADLKTLDVVGMAWVDKHKPTSIKEIVGQAGAASNVTKLMNWLSKWYVNHDGNKKPQRPNPWAKNDDGSFYKAALLSGPPGIGKTTTATLVVKELGFDAVEFNASDTRSKRLLKDEVSTLLSNKSLSGYFTGQGQAVSRKHVLIMDEVDGMAGNEDRGGMQELIALIKDSSIPIICMCNDRNHPKIRSLVNYCYDLRFQRPRLEQIKGKIMSICFKEKVKISPAKVEEIIAATNNDIRQSINHIALLSAKEDASQKSGQQVATKDLKLGPWEVVRKVFTADEHKHMSFADKSDLFFHDYSLAPLFVQQNYLQVLPQGNKKDVLAKVAATADALSLGDLVEKRIRANSAWSLLPTQAFFSSVLPGEHMCGHFTGQINFPGWLGKNSKSGKRARLAQELHDHTRVCTSGSRLSVRLDYAPFLLDNIVRPLAKDGQEGVPAALDVMKDYHLLREDLDSLVELTSWPGKKSPLDAVDGRVKAALTRSYNKEVMAYSYSAQAGIKKKKSEAAGADDDYLDEGPGEEDGAGGHLSSEEDEDKDNLELDSLIKAKKRTTTSKASGGSKKATSSTASKSKAKAKK